MSEENTDDVIRQMQKDDRESVFDLVAEQDEAGMGFIGLELMTPREYALANDMVPQQVYYYIRRGTIKSVACLCGKTVIERTQADNALADRKKKNT